MSTIELTIKQAPMFKGKIWRKQIEMIEEKFDDDALLAVAFSKDGLEQLYVFEKRIYFNKIKGIMSNQEQSIPVNNVSSVECRSKGLYANITVTTSGAAIIVEDVQISIAQEVAKVIDSLKLSNASISTKTHEKDTFDIADEIRELKDLLDEGLITQEEFDAKKKHLLRM